MCHLGCNIFPLTILVLLQPFSLLQHGTVIFKLPQLIVRSIKSERSRQRQAAFPEKLSVTQLNGIPNSAWAVPDEGRPNLMSLKLGLLGDRELESSPPDFPENIFLSILARPMKGKCQMERKACD